jgi:hypothetical protein
MGDGKHTADAHLKTHLLYHIKEGHDSSSKAILCAYLPNNDLHCNDKNKMKFR